MKDLFKDVNGVISSKRVVGFTLAISGLILLLITAFVSVFTTTGDATTVTDIGKYLIITGVGLLGFSTLEHLKK